MNRVSHIFLLAVLLPISLTGQSFQWAANAGGTSVAAARSTATDAKGNVYVAGYFASAITFGSSTFASNGSTDLFIVKYDPDGKVLWAKSAGGNGIEEASSIVVDGNGNAILTGNFGSATLTFGTTTLTKIGTEDMFVAKYDSNGNCLWAKNAGGTGYVHGTSIAADTIGRVCVAGISDCTTIAFGSTMLTNSGAFLVKYDASGNVMWTNSANINAISTTIDVSGNVLIAGTFFSSVVFGATLLPNKGIGDMLAVKYDPDGKVLWAKSAGGSDFDGATSISTDVIGNVVVTGYFGSSTIAFDTTILANNNTGAQDVFIVKYDPDGKVLWANSGGGGSHDGGSSIATDEKSNVYVAGYFNFYTITFDTTALINNGAGDIFIVKYDPDGKVLWAKSAGGNGMDDAYSIATHGNERAYLAGSFASPTLVFGSTTLTRNGTRDMFVVGIDTYVAPVPIQLSSFSAIAFALDSVKLQWMTISETNNYGFEIQKVLPPMTSYQSLSKSFVAGHGTTNEPQHYSYIDLSVTSGDWYYRLTQIDLDGTKHYSDGVRVTVLTSVTEKAIPSTFSISQNYPNPFNPLTTIRYGLPTRSQVTLTVYNTLGQQVATLQNGDQEAGYHEVRFDASGMASGVYFYRITAGAYVETRKLLLVR